MKKQYWILPLLLIMTMCSSSPKGQKVLIETSMGDIKVVLYDETPLHRDNFIKLVNEGYYKNKNFHRVIKSFMIQAGATNTPKDSTFSTEGLVDSEFRTPQYFHKAGALAAARWGDDENPERKSSASQFYIVTGKVVLDNQFQEIERERFEKLKQSILQRYQSETRDTLKTMYKEGNKAGMAELRASNMEKAEKEAEAEKENSLFTDEQKDLYRRVGGAPHLDGAYTVFGEVYEGMDVVRKIENVETAASDKPLEVVTIKSMKLID